MNFIGAGFAGVLHNTLIRSQARYGAGLPGPHDFPVIGGIPTHHKDVGMAMAGPVGKGINGVDVFAARPSVPIKAFDLWGQRIDFWNCAENAICSFFVHGNINRTNFFHCQDKTRSSQANPHAGVPNPVTPYLCSLPVLAGRIGRSRSRWRYCCWRLQWCVPDFVRIWPWPARLPSVREYRR